MLSTAALIGGAILVAIVLTEVLYMLFLQMEQTECLGVVWKSEISMMTRHFASRTT